MSPVRQAIGIDPRTFGRGLQRDLGPPVAPISRPLFSDDLKLFAATFLGGFVFVSVYLA